MPDNLLLSPPTLAALATVAAAIGGELLIRVAWLAARLVRRRGGETPLLREPGARFVRARRRALAEALGCAAAIVAGLTACGVASLVTGTPPWRPPTAAVIAGALLAGLALRTAMLLRRARRLALRRDTRRRVAQALATIGGERDRVFHDVAAGDGIAIDHVLVGNQGAFAIAVADAGKPRGDGLLRRHGRRLRLGDEPRFIDEAAVQRHVAALQHALSKPFGRVLPLRAVLCVPHWRIGDNRDNPLLVVGVRDVVMLQGWRSARDALMSDDAQALHQLLAERDAGLPAPRRDGAPIGRIDPDTPPAAEPAPAGPDAA